MKRILPLVALVALFALPCGMADPAAARAPFEEGPRLFVCGHSFVSFTHNRLPPMAAAAGITHHDAGKQIIGGSTVLQHWNVSGSSNKAKAALRAGRVDVLTLAPHLLMPDVGINNFTWFGLETNPDLRVLVQASWPPRDGYPPGFRNWMRNLATVESLRQQRDFFHGIWLTTLETQVRALNDAVGTDAVFILPVSHAVYALREHVALGTAPGLTWQTDLFSDDLGHPRAPLSELVTYCHFAALFQLSPVGLPVPTTLRFYQRAEELNLLLQEIAWEAVTGYQQP